MPANKTLPVLWLLSVLSTLLVSPSLFADKNSAEISAKTTAKTKVIFDTDMAIDDWSALLLLAKSPNIELLSVVANGAGETRCEPAMRNIPALLDLTQAGHVEVACGDDYPLDGYFAFPEPWRVQADTLSGVTIPDSDRPVSKDHAVEVIHKVLNNETDKVTLLATGSLTNIAQWLTKYPQDKNKIDKLVIMGGAFDAPGNIIVPGFTDEHPNTKAEWNIYVDALAADIVFKSGLSIEVVGLDVTNEVKVTREFAQNFKKHVQTPAADFWDKVLDDNDWFIDSGEYYFWDVLAALVVIDPQYCQGELAPVNVQFDLTQKATDWTLPFPTTTSDGKTRQHYDPKTFGVLSIGGDNPPAKICRKTNATKAFELFTTTMNNAL